MIKLALRFELFWPTVDRHYYFICPNLIKINKINENFKLK